MFSSCSRITFFVRCTGRTVEKTQCHTICFFFFCILLVFLLFRPHRTCSSLSNKLPNSSWCVPVVEFAVAVPTSCCCTCVVAPGSNPKRSGTARLSPEAPTCSPFVACIASASFRAASATLWTSCCDNRCLALLSKPRKEYASFPGCFPSFPFLSLPSALCSSSGVSLGLVHHACCCNNATCSPSLSCHLLRFAAFALATAVFALCSAALLL